MKFLNLNIEKIAIYRKRRFCDIVIAFGSDHSTNAKLSAQLCLDY